MIPYLWSFTFTSLVSSAKNLFIYFYSYQNKGTYVPEGLSKEAYAKFVKEEEAAKAKNAKKFVIGKQAETLTEWMLKEEKKGNSGKGLLLKGHRMVKCKYPEFYTDESPV